MTYVVTCLQCNGRQIENQSNGVGSLVEDGLVQRALTGRVAREQQLNAPADQWGDGRGTLFTDGNRSVKSFDCRLGRGHREGKMVLECLSKQWEDTHRHTATDSCKFGDNSNSRAVIEMQISWLPGARVFPSLFSVLFPVCLYPLLCHFVGNCCRRTLLGAY